MSPLLCSGAFLLGVGGGMVSGRGRGRGRGPARNEGTGFGYKSTPFVFDHT